MAQVGGQVAGKLVDLLNAETTGLRAALADLAETQGLFMPSLLADHIRAENVAPEIAERSTAAKYPAVHVYCERLSNQMREKFRTFSGKARMVIETRVAQDRLEQLEQRSQLMVDAVTSLLDLNRGDWGSGMFYSGGYEVIYAPVKHGGKNFLQITKVSFEIEISAS